MIGARTYFQNFSIAIALLFCALPVLTVLLPPLTDYPNHLVRFWLLAGGTAEPHLSAILQSGLERRSDKYRPRFSWRRKVRAFSTSKAVARFLLFVAAAAAPAGAVLLSRTIFGRPGYWHVLIFATAWTSPLLTGLFSFELGIGIALVFTWLDYATACHRSWTRFCRRALQGFAVLLVHPFGFAYYALLTAGLALGCEKGCLGLHALPGSAKRIALASLPLAVSVLLLALRSLSMPYAAIGANAGYELTWQPLGLEDFALRLIEPLRSYELSADLVFVAALAAPVVWALSRGTLRTHSGLMVIAGALAILGLAAPEQIGSTSHMNVRLLTMAMFTFAASRLPRAGFDRKISGGAGLPGAADGGLALRVDRRSVAGQASRRSVSLCRTRSRSRGLESPAGGRGNRCGGGRANRAPDRFAAHLPAFRRHGRHAPACFCPNHLRGERESSR